jgi:phenylacetate-CoA ligase
MNVLTTHRARPEDHTVLDLTPQPGDLEPIETAPVEEIVLGIPTLSPHFQCHLDRSGNLDTLTVRVERRDATTDTEATAAQTELAHRIKASIGVSVGVDVVGVASIERSVGKMRRIVDHRAAR